MLIIRNSLSRSCYKLNIAPLTYYVNRPSLSHSLTIFAQSYKCPIDIVGNAAYTIANNFLILFVGTWNGQYGFRN